ncbi:hypothetical protein VTN00DRAFT_9802 [Thermoascus crustaceus]|uniref:uncharacterized protein n=1 Tax=Thermoascus crustaceus TaxID=5088 RepID=UPI003743BEF0
MVSGLRRLAADHADLHNSDLPPNYFFPPGSSGSDDLTQLLVMLTGPQGTPYSQGLWRLHLKMPEDYPKSPPKVSFRTRIWHPNIEESTGAVCVDTLKRDWEPKLTLRDVLITISCLLIHPNPDSALNSAAGAMLQDDYEAFARQAKLMTSIHAPIPDDLKEAAMEAKRRGEEEGTVIREEDERRPAGVRKTSGTHTVVMKKRTNKNQTSGETSNNQVADSSNAEQGPEEQDLNMDVSDDENDDPASASKENDPSLSICPVVIAPPSPRKNVLGKRPLSVLATSLDPDTVMDDAGDDESHGMTASEKNIAANAGNVSQQRSSSPQKKSQKLLELRKGANASSRIREDDNMNNTQDSMDCTGSLKGRESQHQIYEDGDESNGDGKENYGSSTTSKEREGAVKATISGSSTALHTISPAPSATVQSNRKASKPVTGTRKVSSATSGKPKPRVGIRRL